MPLAGLLNQAALSAHRPPPGGIRQVSAQCTKSQLFAIIVLTVPDRVVLSKVTGKSRTTS